MSEPDNSGPRLRQWILQPLVNAGLTIEQLNTLVVGRLQFEAVVDPRTIRPADEMEHLLDDQPPEVGAAWKESLRRIAQAESGHVTEDTVPDPDLDEWLLGEIAVEALAAGRAVDQAAGPPPAGSWDPARVLAECAAKRRIVSFAADLTEEGTDDLLRLLALPYADHPGYRQEWRP